MKAAIKATIGDNIMYDLNGASNKINEANPETNITKTWSNFLKSLTIIAKKVKGIANFKPNSSGIKEPNIIPLIVEICQKNHKVIPPPKTW